MTCAATVTNVNSVGRGKVCGRPAKHVDGAGRPVCGFHSPASMARARARCASWGKAVRR